MLNLIIVEDEVFTAEQINNAINWADFDINMNGIFSNGKEALEYISKNNTDVVITDIKMPVMDGITLVEKCKTLSPHTKFIIISSYREFEYARRSISLGVVEYLLKPISYDSLTNAIKTTVDLIYSSNINNSPFQNTSLSSSRQSLFTNILCGVTTSLSDISNKLPAVGITRQILDNPCMIIGVKIHDFDHFISSKWTHSMTQFKDSVTNIIPFETDKLYSMVVNFIFDELFIFIASKDSSVDFKEDVKIYMDSVTKNFIDFFSLTAEYSIISEFANISEIFSNIRQQQDSNANVDIISKCKKYINDNLDGQITLSSIASYVHMNPIYLSTYFKNKTGTNFSTYLKTTRIERAAHLLAHTQDSVSHICDITGFKSESHFYKSFKSAYDMTPQQYRDCVFAEQENTLPSPENE